MLLPVNTFSDPAKLYKKYYLTDTTLCPFPTCLTSEAMGAVQGHFSNFLKTTIEHLHSLHTAIVEARKKPGFELLFLVSYFFLDTFHINRVQHCENLVGETV